ncbi:MAG: sulfatase-like hydrolase/transferase [Bacteroidota bacterium]
MLRNPLTVSLSLILFCSFAQEATKPPNIVLIFADDLGYGDVSCLNSESKIQTPAIDQVAEQGVTFTDAHTSSSVCTPSRYGLLTGRYAWRTYLKNGVLWGYSPPLIKTDRWTVATMLKKAGYMTACIGKWHLGLDWPLKKGESPIKGFKEKVYGGDKVDFSKKIKNGPTSLGFDYFYGISASLDMPPYAFIENDEMTNIPTVKREDGFGRMGLSDVSLAPEDFLLQITEKARNVIKDYSSKKEPFFLYLPLPSPHTPLAVAEPFKNSSTIGPYGDYVIETEWVVAEVMKTLKENKVEESTLLIITSDNGPETSMINRKKEHNHYSAGILRGCKRDNWEGGHRVPFFAKWPQKITPGTTSHQVLCLTDLFSTFSAIAKINVPDHVGEDSYNMLPALLGVAGNQQIREATVHHSSQGKFAIRKGDWVLLLHPGSGGNDRKYIVNTPEIMDEPIALYNIKNDPGQMHNSYKDHPEIVKDLTETIKQYINNGRSTIGPKLQNDPIKKEWKQKESIMSMH